MIRLRASVPKARFGATGFRLRASVPKARFGATGVVLRAVMTALVAMIAGSSTVLACPMCFGAEETSMIDGTRLGVLVMIAITLSVQGAFVAFFLYLRKRAKRIAEADLESEWSELQRISRTSRLTGSDCRRSPRPTVSTSTA
jgi:hypothetical protein